ncbi:hypothetical protein [Streptomyces sp. RKAG337]|uniref:hypothetical protein n=1 Tax=Streptomyces sp. RKAG337 TaxID=2893404 RepID=UPI002033A03E|nr:hypothetical protein [Streptomyces sp. RKAG337]MCM2425091.1 hypothetical protein [Streptomyces sp. RKAG337]
MPENEATPEVSDLGAIPAQLAVTESPTVAVARERLVEAIGREAVFLADQRAGQASEGLETLARAFALVAGTSPIGSAEVGASAGNAGLIIKSRGSLLPVDQNEIVQRETVQLPGR